MYASWRIQPRVNGFSTPRPHCASKSFSRDDSMIDILERVKEYFEMGVPVCWIIDPRARTGWIATPGYLAQPSDGVLRAGDLEMPIFDVLPTEL
jgi:Uma2 family endonuclease